MIRFKINLLIVVLLLLVLGAGEVEGQIFFNNKGQRISVTSGTRLTIVGSASNEGILRNEGIISVSGDWFNQSNYLSDAGTFILNGDNIQSVSHNGETFYILELSGGGRKVFTSDVEIISSLLLISGVAEVPSDRSFLLREGVSISGGSDQSYISGKAEVSGTGDLLFPVGANGQYLPVELLDVTGVNPVTGIRVISPNVESEAGFELSAVSDLRYWERTLESGEFTDAIVKLSLRDETVSGTISDLVVASSETVGGEYTGNGQSSAVGDIISGNITSRDRISSPIYSIGRTLNEGRVADSIALRRLLVNNPGPWTTEVNWATEPNLNNWDSITVNSSGRVTEIRIRNGGMSGVLTSELRVMDALTSLNLSDNELKGSFPSQLTQLRSLASLDVSNNSLETIPDLRLMTNLISADVRGNQLLFSSLERNTGKGGISYSPQDSLLNTGGYFTFKSGSDFELSVADDSPNNEYQWYYKARNSTDWIVVNGAESFGYVITDLNRGNMGSYYCEINNTSVGADANGSQLKLYSKVSSVFAVATISGMVNTTTTSFLTAGDVKLLEVKSGAWDTLQISPLLSSGSYEFENVILSDYVVLADPFDRNLYIPTYYDGSIQWDESALIVLSQDTSNININIEIKPDESQAGDGSLTGDVFTDFPESGRIEARRRVRRVGVALRRRRGQGRSGEGRFERVEDEDFELVAYTQTDDEGKFSFENLLAGLYRIFIEYPGIPINEDAFTEFEITADGQNNDVTVQATVFEDGIDIAGGITGIPKDYLSELSIYPNPVEGGELNVAMTSASGYEIDLELVDLSGMVLKSIRLNRTVMPEGVARIDISYLSNGMYLLRIKVPSYNNQLYKVGKLIVNGR